MQSLLLLYLDKGHDFANENEKGYNLASKSFNCKQQYAPLAFCRGYISRIHLPSAKNVFLQREFNCDIR